MKQNLREMDCLFSPSPGQYRNALDYVTANRLLDAITGVLRNFL